MKSILLSMCIVILCFITFNDTLAQQVRQIELQKDIIIGGSRIGLVQGIKVDGEGRIYVGDLVRSVVHLYSSSGKFIRDIGRKGEGPGEFERIWGIQIGSKDSLFVYDPQLYRITILTRNSYDKPVGTIRISNAPGMFGRPATVGSLNSGLNGFWILKNGNFLLSYSNDYSPQNFMQPHDLSLFEVRRDGTFVSKNPFLTLHGEQYIVFTEPGFMVSKMPYAERPVIHAGSDGYIYYAENSDLSINALNLGGKVIKTIRSPVAKIGLNDRLWREGLEKLDLQLSVTDLERSRTPLPKYQPVFEDFLVDSQSRVWVAVNTGDRDNYSWWIFTKEGKKIEDIPLARSVVLKVVKGDYAYGIDTGNLGVQSIVRYKILKDRK
ncbi:MAG: 6-bladed beta-propeller [Candidatus Kryptoniota bacterium]